MLSSPVRASCRTNAWHVACLPSARQALPDPGPVLARGPSERPCRGKGVALRTYFSLSVHTSTVRQTQQPAPVMEVALSKQVLFKTVHKKDKRLYIKNILKKSTHNKQQQQQQQHTHTHTHTHTQRQARTHARKHTHSRAHTHTEREISLKGSFD